MRIGIDLSPLQSDHRWRGIGYTLINFINNIPADEREQNSYIFYVLPLKDDEDPLDLLDLNGLQYEVRQLKVRERIGKVLPGRLNILISVMNQLRELGDYQLGDSRITDTSGLDAFLQTDQSQCLPRGRKLKKYLILYDIIPFVLAWDYLWSYSIARKNKYSRKASLRFQAKRWLYSYKLKINARRAHKLLAISEHTKKDFVQYLSVPAKKITVTPLGVTVPQIANPSKQPALHYYHKTSWGHMIRPLTLDPEVPFILFVGGADRRRRLEDLVAAFNVVRAQGHLIKLVLAGDTMQGLNKLLPEATYAALEQSSYHKDIVFMGFVDDDVREWLYQQTLAFVFPSKYEGFGLPVLEAMSYGTPVIAYDNPVISEVAGDIPVYAENMLQLSAAIVLELKRTRAERSTLSDRSIRQASLYSWVDTSHVILEVMRKSGNRKS